jgi:hypothetical protein
VPEELGRNRVAAYHLDRVGVTPGKECGHAGSLGVHLKT